MTEDQRKHLDMIQGVISRMAANSFTAKGWSVGAVSALLALAVGTKQHWIAAVALLPSVVFWYLDGKFLHLERQYRMLFADVVAGKTPPLPYQMDAKEYEPTDTSAWFSWSVAPVHGIVVLVVVAVVGMVALNAVPSESPDPVVVRLRDTVNVRTIPR